MVEWPQELRSRLSNPVRVSTRIADIPPEVLREVVNTESFAALVQAITNAFIENADPKSKLTELSAVIDQPDVFGDYDETVRQVVLALATVAALKMEPTRAMWEYLWSLAWHSAPLATFLPQAVITAATEPAFRNQFLAVARDVVEEAARNPGRRAIQRNRDIGPNLREQWHKHPELSILWRGRFEHSFHVVDRDDDHVLSIVAEIDLAEFVQLLAIYDYPDPVAHALMWAGVPWRFERWRTVAAVAPVAFEQHSKWNGSLVLPLLLAIARDQFQFDLGREPTPNQIAETTNNIRFLAAEVVKAIALRADAFECMTRWGNWLVRNVIPAASANPIPNPTNAASQGFIDDALLDAIIVEMPMDRWRSEPSPDAEEWEYWCQFAVGTLITLAGKTVMPSAATFLDDWRLSPEGWQAQRGQKLRLRAFPFEGGQPRADGYGARLLALAMVEDADAYWKTFWDTTATLREIVEFGDPDGDVSGGWEGTADAARLLMFQFSIGLMMMDHLVRPLRPLGCDRRLALRGMVSNLDEAIREMAAIDQLNEKFWSEAVRHLAIRRAVWLSDHNEFHDVALGPDEEPTLAHFVSALAGDTENLLALIWVALQNGVNKNALAEAFKAANVDICSELSIAEHLLDISPRAITLNREQLDVVRQLVDTHLGPAPLGTRFA
jgi:hypothetical protein